jgi:hypothetical protein
LATDGFEEAELMAPVRVLREAGATAIVIAPHRGKVQGPRYHEKSKTVDVRMTLDEAEAAKFDALMCRAACLAGSAGNERTGQQENEPDSMEIKVGHRSPCNRGSAGCLGFCRRSSRRAALASDTHLGD